VNYTTIAALVDVSFVGNSSQSYGGALTNFGTVDVANSDVFNNNFAQNGAGAVNNDGTINTLDSTSFTGNRSGYAGAIDNGGTIQRPERRPVLEQYGLRLRRGPRQRLRDHE